MTISNTTAIHREVDSKCRSNNDYLVPTHPNPALFPGTNTSCDTPKFNVVVRETVGTTVLLWGQLFALCEEGRGGAGFDQFAGLIEMVHHHLLRFDPERMVDGGQQFGGMHRILDRRRGGFVRLAVYVAPFDAGAGD